MLTDEEIEKSLEMLDSDLRNTLAALKMQPRVMAVVAKAGIMEVSTFSMMGSSGPGTKDWAWMMGSTRQSWLRNSV